ncbi:DUF397 domain-containing protein [Streptomyces sp. NBC_00101]|uniref:DUF397 domain-containing protein n=1 Tax=Streptomyces sp. NBC_00101 TaxID=2975651 RepID=UPI0032522482
MRIEHSVRDASDLAWFKSSYSTNDGPDCVEVASAASAVHVRDSKNLAGPRLNFRPASWIAFVGYAGH